MNLRGQILGCQNGYWTNDSCGCGYFDDYWVWRWAYYGPTLRNTSCWVEELFSSALSELSPESPTYNLMRFCICVHDTKPPPFSLECWLCYVIIFPYGSTFLAVVQLFGSFFYALPTCFQSLDGYNVFPLFKVLDHFLLIWWFSPTSCSHFLHPSSCNDVWQPSLLLKL